jgi:DNA-binding NarL/FixJ family response regulator
MRTLPPVSRITVGIAAADAILCEALTGRLAHQEDLQVAGVAADGAQAIALAQTAQPHILLLDIRMPGLNGLLALPQIRKKGVSTSLS